MFKEENESMQHQVKAGKEAGEICVRLLKVCKFWPLAALWSNVLTNGFLFCFGLHREGEAEESQLTLAKPTTKQPPHHHPPKKNPLLFFSPDQTGAKLNQSQPCYLCISEASMCSTVSLAELEAG